MNCDVIGFQEVFSKKALKELLKELGFITALDKDKALDFANTIKEKIEDLQIEHNAREVSSYITI